jgi:hypothetical protein
MGCDDAPKQSIGGWLQSRAGKSYTIVRHTEEYTTAEYTRHYRFTERDGRKGPPAENKARCNRTNTTQQGNATQSEAEPETSNPHTDLNNLSRGLGETAHRSPAGGTRRDVRARPTQGRVAPAKGNAKLPKRPRHCTVFYTIIIRCFIRLTPYSILYDRIVAFQNRIFGLSRAPCVGWGCLVRLRFVLHSLAVWRVHLALCDCT